MYFNNFYNNKIIYCWCLIVIILVCHGCSEYNSSHTKAAAAKNYRAALVYLNNDIVGEDTDKGIALLTQSANDGYVLAQNKLGFLYAEGRLVPRDLTTAMHNYELAAGNGFAVSQYNLAEIYRTGVAAEKNDRIAFQWYLKSALQAYPAAMYRVAEGYHHGNGIVPDRARAFAWYQLTVKAGFPVPVQVYEEITGEITPADLESANRYLHRLARQMK